MMKAHSHLLALLVMVKCFEYGFSFVHPSHVRPINSLSRPCFHTSNFSITARKRSVSSYKNCHKPRLSSSLSLSSSNLFASSKRQALQTNRSRTFLREASASPHDENEDGGILSKIFNATIGRLKAFFIFMLKLIIVKPFNKLTSILLGNKESDLNSGKEGDSDNTVGTPLVNNVELDSVDVKGDRLDNVGDDLSIDKEQLSTVEDVLVHEMGIDGMEVPNEFIKVESTMKEEVKGVGDDLSIEKEQFPAVKDDPVYEIGLDGIEVPNEFVEVESIVKEEVKIVGDDLSIEKEQFPAVKDDPVHKIGLDGIEVPNEFVEVESTMKGDEVEAELVVQSDAVPETVEDPAVVFTKDISEIRSVTTSSNDEKKHESLQLQQEDLRANSDETKEDSHSNRSIQKGSDAQTEEEVVVEVEETDTGERATPLGPRWAVSGPDVDLSGKWKILVTDEFKKDYDQYLKKLGQPSLVRSVAVSIVEMTTEEVIQSDQGRSLCIKGKNLRGLWDRTLVASGSDYGVKHGEDEEHMKVPMVTADKEKVEAESWWEKDGTVHRSWLRGVKKYGGGDFESKRYLSENGDVLICESQFHPRGSDKDNAVIEWKFERVG